MAKSKAATIAIPASERDWQAESDMNALMRAEEIKRDKNRHAKAKSFARQHLAHLKAITTQPSNNVNAGPDIENPGDPEDEGAGQ